MGSDDLEILVMEDCYLEGGVCVVGSVYLTEIHFKPKISLVGAKVREAGISHCSQYGDSCVCDLALSDNRQHDRKHRKNKKNLHRLLYADSLTSQKSC